MLRPTRVVLLLLLSMLAAQAETPRFYRLLKLYRDPTYTARDRDVRLDVRYDSRSEDDNPGELGISDEQDRVQTLDRSLEGELAVGGRRYQGDTLRERARSWGVEINGHYDESSYERSNEMIGRADVDNEQDLRFNGEAWTAFDWDRYVKRKRRGWRFWGLYVDAQVEGSVTKEREYQEYQLSYVDSNWSVERRYVVDAQVFCRPIFGFGRQIPVTPLLEALEIERGLREVGAIDSELSDSTLVRVAHWIATRFVHGVRHDVPDKFFYAALDSILALDSAVQADTSVLNGRSSQRVAQALDEPFPELRAGLLLTVEGWLRVRVQYDDSRIEPATTLYGNGGLDFDQANAFFLLGLDWQRPISPRIFLNIGTQTEPLCGSYREISTESITTAAHHARVCFLLTNRFILKAGFADLECKYWVIPQDLPGTMRIEARYFVEDNLSIELSFTKLRESYRGVAYERRTDAEGLGVGVKYEF